MKYLVISDIHSNLEAFEKLLNIKKVKEVDKILFLGDLVGYGANPNEVIELFRSLKNVAYIRGNHDKVVAGIESSSLFNPVAAFSAEWSKNNVTKENLEFLKNIEMGPKIVDHFSTICHGSVFDEDYYVFSVFEASESMKSMETSVAFYGHTHFPVMYLLRNNKIDTVPFVKDTKIKLDSNTKYLINPGSIGQPRDKDPRPSYIIFDSNKRELLFQRFSYSIKKTQKKIREAGLPDVLASRLESGI